MIGIIIAVILWLGFVLTGVLSLLFYRREREKWVLITGVGLIVGGSVICFWIFFPSLMSFLGEWLWYKSQGFSQIFWKILITKYGLWAAGTIFSFLFYFRLLWWVVGGKNAEERGLKLPLVGILAIAGCLSLIFGPILASFWQKYLLFSHYAPSGTEEPILHKDVSWYLLRFPFLWAFTIWLKVVLIVGITVLGIVGLASWSDEHEETLKRTIVMGAIVSVSLCLVGIWRSILRVANLLFSERGAVFGASFTDVHLQIPCYKIYIGALVGVILLWLLAGGARNLKLKILFSGISSGIWFFSWLTIVVIIPAFYQSLVVRPNELEKEKPYIAYHIEYTRKAYKLENVQTSSSLSHLASSQELSQRKKILRDIRLWDWRALKDTLQQIQAIRWYYQFYDVDIDRYHLNGHYRQVMLAARELNIERLPEKVQTWINQRLKYTHGYGLCMNFVNEFTPEGLPHLIVSDIPPKAEYPKLEIKRPEIYYGELSSDWVIVNTKEPEFDYPAGEENVYSHYQGRGGVLLSSGIRRLIYTIKLGSLKILISGQITSNSRLLLYRQIKERIRKITPYLELDDDPYLVVVKGKLYWIVDAYTSSKWYPYSERMADFNYFRNSVKVVVDAYEGTVRFYVFDSEPLIQAWAQAFPGVFLSKEEMPKELLLHIRYPDRFFGVQVKIWAVYHMEDPQVFYNREDLWEIPKEVYQSSKIEMIPYYVLVTPPGEKERQFINMIAFTPVGKLNLVAWMAGFCDPEEYGKLVVYPLEKGKLFFGPEQIEARVDQDKTMSAQITLWNQQGSQVIRGNLLVVPLENSLFYIEPLYLQATNAKMPELKQVIVGTADTIAWAENLEKALDYVGGVGRERKVIESERRTITPSQKLGQIIQTLQSLLRQLEELKQTLR